MRFSENRNNPFLVVTLITKPNKTFTEFVEGYDFIDKKIMERAFFVYDIKNDKLIKSRSELSDEEMIDQIKKRYSSKIMNIMLKWKLKHDNIN